jgi:hypothetical protein
MTDRTSDSGCPALSRVCRRCCVLRDRVPIELHDELRRIRRESRGRLDDWCHGSKLGHLASSKVARGIERSVSEGRNSRRCASEEDALRGRLESLRTRLSGRYKNTSVIGVAGSGVVLRLKDDQLSDKPVALKFPRPVQGQTDALADPLGKKLQQISRVKSTAEVGDVVAHSSEGTNAFE